MNMNVLKGIKFFKVVIFSFIFSITLSLSALAATPKWCQDGNKVKFGEPTWESANFYTELAKFIVEKGYDCETDVVAGSKAITATGLIRGDLDVIMEVWLSIDPILTAAFDKGEVQLIGSLLEGGTLEAWFVPSYMVKGDKKRGIKATAPGLKSVKDLPKYTKLFADPENPKKGLFLSCPTGWDCETVNTQKLKAYNLDKIYTNFRPGTGGALDAEIVSSVKRGKPVVFYYWSPSSLLGKYDFYQLEEPPFNEECWKTLFNSKTDDACGSSSPSTDLAVGLAIEFYNSAPELLPLFKSMQIPVNVLNKALSYSAESNQSDEENIKNFLKTNKKLLETWVPKDVYNKVVNSL